MRTLVTGAGGQLGQELRKAQETLLPQADFVFVDQETIDYEQLDSIEPKLSELRPKRIINCAAYTAVDKAESDSKRAEKVNVQAVDRILRYCEKESCELIHISTDFVFSGKKQTPYVESDSKEPVSVYGMTKARSEELISASRVSFAIIRASWLYSSFGNNFLKTMFRLFQEREELGVVVDQVGTPTYAADLAEFILNEAPQLLNSSLYHFSNSGVASWYDFAAAIARLSRSSVQLRPITTEEYPTPAQRPVYSVLSKKKIHRELGHVPEHWIGALERCMHELSRRSS